MARKHQLRNAEAETVLTDWQERADKVLAVTSTVDAMRDETGAVLGEMYHRPDASDFDRQAISLVWDHAQRTAQAARMAGAAIQASTSVFERMEAYRQQAVAELDALQQAVKRGDRSNDLVRALSDSEHYAAVTDLHSDVMIGVQKLTGVRHWPAALALVSALLSPDDSGLTADEQTALRELCTAVMLRMEAQEALAS